MHARSWLVLATICTLVCTSGCGSVRWGNRHSKLRGFTNSSCVESSCDDPTCEICSPLPPLYDGMARNHRLNRRSMRGHGHHGRRGDFESFGGCSCGQCCGEWFEGEIIEGEIIGGDCFGGCSTCMSGCSTCMSDGEVIYDGMPMEMSGGCSTCGQHGGMDSSMMMSSPQGHQTFEPQPTPAAPPTGGPSSAPKYSPSPMPMAPGSSVPAEIPMEQAAPGPMGEPMAPPMTSMRAPNYGQLFSAPPSEPRSYVPTSSSMRPCRTRRCRWRNRPLRRWPPRPRTRSPSIWPRRWPLRCLRSRLPAPRPAFAARRSIRPAPA